jgi:uncharacterized protein (DUF169 family)
MLKEDHWCPAPLLAYGMVQRTDDPVQQNQSFDCFPYGKYAGIVTAPLRQTNFIPDVVIIYSNNSQLRSLLLSMSNEESSLIDSRFLPPSCSYAVVNVMQTGKYWVVLPDPGEYERGVGTEDEMMFAVPGKKMDTLIAGLRKNEKGTSLTGIIIHLCVQTSPSPTSIKICSNLGVWIPDKFGQPASLP